MLPSTTIVISKGVNIRYNSNIRYMFCNKSSKAFLERQMFKDKHIPLLTIEAYSFDATFCHLFTHSHHFLHSNYYLQI